MKQLLVMLEEIMAVLLVIQLQKELNMKLVAHIQVVIYLKLKSKVLTYQPVSLNHLQLIAMKCLKRFKIHYKE